jgi:cardiolipin synthase
VSIYEYEPGFLHAKTIVSDDRIAVVGTINMDFRSLYLHFECGVLMTDENTARVIKNDDEQIIQKSRVIKKGFPKRTLAGRIFDSILRSMSPLL